MAYDWPKGHKPQGLVETAGRDYADGYFDRFDGHTKKIDQAARYYEGWDMAAATITKFMEKRPGPMLRLRPNQRLAKAR